MDIRESGTARDAFRLLVRHQGRRCGWFTLCFPGLDGVYQHVVVCHIWQGHHVMDVVGFRCGARSNVAACAYRVVIAPGVDELRPRRVQFYYIGGPVNVVVAMLRLRPPDTKGAPTGQLTPPACCLTPPGLPAPSVSADLRRLMRDWGWDETGQPVTTTPREVRIP